MLFYCCRLLIFTRSRSLLFNRLDYYIAPEVRTAALTPKYTLEEIDPYSALKRAFASRRSCGSFRRTGAWLNQCNTSSINAQEKIPGKNCSKGGEQK